MQTESACKHPDSAGDQQWVGRTIWVSFLVEAVGSHVHRLKDRQKQTTKHCFSARLCLASFYSYPVHTANAVAPEHTMR